MSQAGDGAAQELGPMIGPLVSEAQRARVLGFIERARNDGCTLFLGGRAPRPDEVVAEPAWRREAGFYVLPTIFSDVPEDAELWREEVFGPVMVILPFDTDDEAIRIANACAFGLGGNVFSRNQNRALSLARRLECGMASINDFATTYMSQSLPFGGVKESGLGREGVKFAIEDMTEVRMMVVRTPQA